MRFGRGLDNRRLKATGYRYRFTTRETILRLGEHQRIEPILRGAQPQSYRYERELEEFLRYSPSVRPSARLAARGRAAQHPPGGGRLDPCARRPRGARDHRPAALARPGRPPGAARARDRQPRSPGGDRRDRAVAPLGRRPVTSYTFQASRLPVLNSRAVQNADHWHHAGRGSRRRCRRRRLRVRQGPGRQDRQGRHRRRDLALGPHRRPGPREARPADHPTARAADRRPPRPVDVVAGRPRSADRGRRRRRSSTTRSSAAARATSSPGPSAT